MCRQFNIIVVNLGGLFGNKEVVKAAQTKANASIVGVPSPMGNEDHRWMSDPMILPSDIFGSSSRGGGALSSSMCDQQKGH